jgi:gliding motility-associated-like protein
VNANFNSNSIIFIYDRYGEIHKPKIKPIVPWDGTFNVSGPLPSDNGYTVKFSVKMAGAKGHFSLKDK